MAAVARVLIDNTPDEILNEEVHAEDFGPMLPGPLKLKPELTVGVCLAPEGRCACARQEKPGPEACWRVRLPWLALSPMLFPERTHLQCWGFETNAAAPGGMSTEAKELGAAVRALSATSGPAPRSRTPSPDRTYSALRGCETLPARLLLAPTAGVEPYTGNAPGGPYPVSIALPLLGRMAAEEEAKRGANAQGCGRQGNVPLAGASIPNAANSGIGAATNHAGNASSCGPPPSGPTAGGGKRPESRRKPRRRGRHCALQIATHLKRLDEFDPRCVVSVRKINRLGFAAEGWLRAHFEQYGPVEEILLSGAQELLEYYCADEDGAARCRSTKARLRPSGFGFVLMANVDAAEAAIGCGGIQVVGGIEVTVQRFERRNEGPGAPAAESSGEEAAAFSPARA